MSAIPKIIEKKQVESKYPDFDIYWLKFDDGIEHLQMVLRPTENVSHRM